MPAVTPLQPAICNDSTTNISIKLAILLCLALFFEYIMTDILSCSDVMQIYIKDVSRLSVVGVSNPSLKALPRLCCAS